MNPYQSLPAKAFWRSAIAERPLLGIGNLWAPKFNITPTDNIVTAGSCFAQHISRSLLAHGYTWLDAEPAPPMLSAEQKRNFGFGVFSFRTGNIYTTAMLRQWLSWALEKTEPPAEAWITDGRVYDPFRPNVEPNGFSSTAEMLASRENTLAAIRAAVKQASVFVFTLGLTEAWINSNNGAVYPMCPGTVAGTFDPSSHEFKNYSYNEVLSNLQAAVNLMRKANEQLRVLLTVSPVPLTAIASDDHVLVATTYSKSTLRAVAGDLARELAFVDYFPSYEIIATFPFRGIFFGPNMRSVGQEGVDFVMKSFFRALNDQKAPAEPSRSQARPAAPAIDSHWAASAKAQRALEETQCEEELLAAFGDTK